MSEDKIKAAGGQADSPGPVSPEFAALAAQLGHIAGPVKTVMDVVIRGLLLQNPGVAPHILLNAIAWQAGNILGTVPQGPLPLLIQLRRGMKEAFADGLGKAPLTDPGAKQAAAVMTAPPRR